VPGWAMAQGQGLLSCSTACAWVMMWARAVLTSARGQEWGHGEVPGLIQWAIRLLQAAKEIQEGSLGARAGRWRGKGSKHRPNSHLPPPPNCFIYFLFYKR
jgi:hypothetical protein